MTYAVHRAVIPHDYPAPWWLPGPHLQTMYPPLCAPVPAVAYRRIEWATPDGDSLVVDECGVRGPTLPVILLHGLEGSSQSHYARSLMHAVCARGGFGMVVHWRGCGGTAFRRPRAYHSGDTVELDWILRRARDEVGAPVFAAGVSLGGNVLLKWLGERGSSATDQVRRVAAVSVPFDLAAGSDALERGAGRLYARYFLRTMLPKAAAMLQSFPDLFDGIRLAKARTLREFDNFFTAPIHGFRDSEDYYRRSSSLQYLPGIRVPALLVSARNDPFLPPAYLPARSDLPAEVETAFSDGGGHAGFCWGPPPGRCDWLPERILAFFQPS